MHANLRTTLAAAVLVAAVPAAGIASAHEGKGKGRGDKSGKRCERGKGYEAKGLLAAGSTLEQVAGADTTRRSDDRFSGTVVIQVKQGNRRGRQDKGLTSFVVTNVRALGTVEGVSPLPPEGTRVQVVGKLAKGCAPAPTTPTTTPTPTPTPEPTATQLRREETARTTPSGDDSAGSDYPAGSDDPSSDTPEVDAPKVSAAVISLVVFKPARQRPEKVRGEDGPSDRERPRGEQRGDDAPCGPAGERQSYGEEEDDLDDRVCTNPKPGDQADRGDDQDDDETADDEDDDDARGPRR